MSIPTDIELNRAIRRIFVKHWIDLGRISVRSSNGRVLIRGRLQRIEGMQEELTTAIVEAIFQEIQRIRGIKMITPHLDNWLKDGGRWRRCERHSTRVDQS